MRIWKLSDLIDDYATLADGAGYGYVDNVLFNDNGQIQAVIISSSTGHAGANYAYPFYSYDYGWDPVYSAYHLPYTNDEVSGLGEFDVGRYSEGN